MLAIDQGAAGATAIQACSNISAVHTVMRYTWSKRMQHRLHVLVFVASASVACGRSGFTELDRQGGGDEDDAGSQILDWRLMNAEQWPLVRAELVAAAAKGVSGPPTATQIGDDLMALGDYKFTGNVMGVNGRIYGIPGDASRAIEIDPATSPASVKAVGPVFTMGGGRWLGGVLAANGIIYGIPYNEPTLLRIDTISEPVFIDTVPVNIPEAGTIRRWGFSTRAFDGKIYAAPCTGNTVLVVDPETDPPTVSEIKNIDLEGVPENSAYLWLGSVIAPATGLIYAVPYAAKRVLRIDPVAGTAVSIGPNLSNFGDNKWCGAALGADGVILAAPDGAKRILRIDPATEEITVLTTSATGGDGATFAPSGVLFLIPWSATVVRTYDVQTGVTGTVSVSPLSTLDLNWASGRLAPNGHIYATPTRAPRVLDIDTRSVGTLPLDVLLGGFVNIY
ncbi:MAG: hypothetical protein H7Z43_09125 [Clostridia bacterium]|nr:hypothetical protein [Deltaproteobacteria bacterium]